MDQLDEKEYVRHRLYSGDGVRKWQRYAAFVIGDQSVLKLIDYELRILFFSWVPGALGLFIRKISYRKLFKNVGCNLIVGRNVTIRHGDKISLGDNIVLDDGCVIDGRGSGQEGVVIGDNTIIGRSAIVQSKVGAIRIGANVNVGTYSVITSQGGVDIGDWVQIAGGCKLSGGRFKLDLTMKEGVPFKRFSLGAISIGDCCFVGGSAQITDGVSIGRHSVIGAGSVVMSNIPEGSVYMPRPGMIMGSTLNG